MHVHIPMRLDPLRRVEHGLLEALADSSRNSSTRIRVTAAATGERCMRAKFLRWFFVNAIQDSRASVTEVFVQGFEIEGSLDLSGCRLGIRPVFKDCHFLGDIDLTEATIPGFAVLGGRVPGIYADRTTVVGSLLLRTAEVINSGHFRLTVSKSVRLNGATVEGNLDMEGALLRGDPTEDSARLALEADGLTVKGNVLLRNTFHATGEIRLNGAIIHRNLDCSGARLRNPGGYTLSAAGARIDGSTYLGRRAGDLPNKVGRPFTSQGAIRLDGTRIDGDLDCTGGSYIATAFLNEKWTPRNGNENLDIYAIHANGLEVGADIYLMGGFHSRGTVSFINGRAGNDLQCSGAWFDSPGGEALCADGMKIGGTAFIDGQFRTNGVLRFVLAHFAQGFYVRDARFEQTAPHPKWLAKTNLLVEDFDGPACGILAREATVSGSFILRNVTCSVGDTPARLQLGASKADVIDDDLESWTRITSFDVSDCTYRMISGLVEPADREKYPLDYYVKARISLLDCEYAPRNKCRRRKRRHASFPSLPHRQPTVPVTAQESIDRFRPQPYLQLARTLRGAGLDAYANEVMVHLERNRTRYGGYDLVRRIGRYCLDAFLRYGYSTFRPVGILVIWALISAIVFESAYSAGRIVPTGANLTSQQTPRVQFNAIVFAIDTLVPLVDLNQRKNWVVDPPTRYWREQPQRKVSWLASLAPLWLTAPDRFPALLFIFNTFFGWLMTTLFAAGVSGFLRRGQGG